MYRLLLLIVGEEKGKVKKDKEGDRSQESGVRIKPPPSAKTGGKDF
jgi:hypothetical protein